MATILAATGPAGGTRTTIAPGLIIAGGISRAIGRDRTATGRCITELRSTRLTTARTTTAFTIHRTTEAHTTRTTRRAMA